ncbi:MBL fold metallo-hydrolase [Ottowia sp.]|uniref:MBL fold metallo-hydrolase n=1 Tax=Ottowia sp. TaxID=1898956 RepID=UPI003A8C3222
MPRTSQLIHPPTPPAPTRPAATVLLLRDAPDGFEVLMTRRSLTASFAPGAYVFPGGGIDAADAQAHHQATRRATQNDVRLTQAIAAIRESFEELGVLLAQRPDGAPATATDALALRRDAAFLPQAAERNLKLAAHDVFVLAHWVTDRDLPKRFDVPFLVARMPDGQTPVADEAEQFEPVWIRPRQALERHAAGDFLLIYPTIRTLDRLQHYADVQAVLTDCAHTDEPLWHSCPRAGWLKGQEARYMEHEPPFGELALVCPDGQIEHHLDWQSERPVPLLKNVQRLTAPNANLMTGPGTNSYLVGNAATGYIVIDPGPHDPTHIQRLFNATGGDIRLIVCTHSHADHSPGAKPLQALCNGQPPVLGLPSQPTARPNSAFTPDVTLQDQELLTLVEQAPEVEITHTLRVIHTPGHAANHLCLLLQEDGLLFSGDHILNGSTTVVDPPDGDMTDYLESLDKLDAACVAGDVQFILPAHGHVLGSARAVIAHLKGHRLAREAKVRAAMQAVPGGDLDDWVPLAYDDVPPAIWPLAKRSMLAHVERLRTLHPNG